MPRLHYRAGRYAVVSTGAAKDRWGHHRHVGVVELDDPDLPQDWCPRLLSERARGVRMVVFTGWECYVGRTTRCAFERALAAAVELAGLLEEARAAEEVE